MYLYGKFSVNEDGYLNFNDEEHFLLRIKNVPDCIEVSWCEDNTWKDGYIMYNPADHKYYVHQSCHPQSTCVLMNYNERYRIRSFLYFMLDAHREDCRARDKIFYADGSYLSYQRKVVV